MDCFPQYKLQLWSTFKIKPCLEAIRADCGQTATVREDYWTDKTGLC